jgi:hypothetical protein
MITTQRILNPKGIYLFADMDFQNIIDPSNKFSLLLLFTPSILPIELLQV